MMSTNDAADVVIVGAGIAGLCAAYALRSSLPEVSVRVLEAADRVGGNLRRALVGDIPVDTGAQTVGGGSSELAALLQDLGLAEHKIAPAAPEVRIFTNGQLRQVPRWSDTGPLVREVLRHGYVSPPAAASAAAHAVVGRFLQRPGADEPLGRAVRSAVTSRAADSLLSPVRQSSFDPSLPRRSRTGRHAWGLAGGTARLAERLGEELSSLISLRSPVARIVPVADRWHLLNEDGSVRLSARSVISAVPAPVAGRLLADTSAAAPLSCVRYRASATVTFRFDAGMRPLAPGVTGILVGAPELSPLVAVTFVDRKFDSPGTSANVVRCSLRLTSSHAMRHQELADLAVDLLGRVCGPLPTIADRVVDVFPHGVPETTAETAAHLKEAIGHLARHGLYLSGAYLSRPSGLRSAIASGFAAARLAAERSREMLRDEP
ncbi:FAD-dependent oxidoreductase [Streptomyces sp. NPDC006372]|uniref:protoporphyrinogen/coproporphyrinogen oxidase n=1 Tax=Streptomyces sp. NPDC006372 TaxID=3155599 RepID=UPI0033AEE625